MNEKDYERDPYSRALINSNVDAYEAHKRKRAIQAQKNLEMEGMKNDITELKNLVSQLLNKLEDKDG
jgi:hypothetical protein